MSDTDFDSDVVYKITTPPHRQFFKHEKYDNSHYGIFEKNSGSADTMMVTQEDMEHERAELFNDMIKKPGMDQ